ncbi:MAG: hypothetical protein VKL42_04455 [Snowella sp.]|nr:hypothetical protein [Snowella sp.]
MVFSTTATVNHSKNIEALLTKCNFPQSWAFPRFPQRANFLRRTADFTQKAFKLTIFIHFYTGVNVRDFPTPIIKVIHHRQCRLLGLWEFRPLCFGYCV